MKAIGTILLSVVVLAVAVSAQECTRENCGEGPVWASFSSSIDCSGTPTYTKVSVNENCNSYVKGFLGEDRYSVTYYKTADCDESYGSWSETFVFDICSTEQNPRRGIVDEQMMTHSQRHQASMKRGTANTLEFNSRILLANVNATLPTSLSGFQYDSSLTVASTSWAKCYSTDNCTLADGTSAKYYRNYYSSANCSNLQYSEMMPHFQPGQCYNLYNRSYVQISCNDENSYQTVYYTNPSCSGTAYYYVQSHIICSPYSNYLGLCSDSFEPIYSAPIEIIPANDPPTPTGNTSSLYGSIMAIFAAILAIFAI